MTDDNEMKLGNLLRQFTAVPTRDPFFRIRLLARRERQRQKFRIRLLSVTGVGSVAAVATAVVVDAGLSNAVITLAAFVVMAAPIVQRPSGSRVQKKN